MEVKFEIEKSLTIEDGYYTYGGNGFIEYWEIKNNEVVLNATISDNQITIIKNEASIPQNNTYYLERSTKISKFEFDRAIYNLKERI